MRAIVILPTYNEVENIVKIVPAILRQDADLDVLVVDDNSPDGTGSAAENLARQTGRVKVLHRAGKQGLASAYLAGFEWALARNYSFIIEMDADFSHNPTALPQMLHLARTGQADLILGSRWMPGGGTRNWALSRKLISRGGSWYARTLLGVKVLDLTGGFKCFSRRVLENIELAGVQANGYAFQIELTYRALEALA
jgi:dolichol-phosphate mannosyltransferase